jgi:hypothetical protein
VLRQLSPPAVLATGSGRQRQLSPSRAMGGRGQLSAGNQIQAIMAFPFLEEAFQ